MNAYQKALGHLADPKLAKKVGHRPPRKLGGFARATVEPVKKDRTLHNVKFVFFGGDMFFGGDTQINWNGEAIYAYPRAIDMPRFDRPRALYSAESRWSAKREAMRKLWSGVAAKLVFRHPDPLVSVQPHFSGTPTIYSQHQMPCYGKFSILNMKDTTSDRRYNNFEMIFQCGAWPGREMAELYMTYAWTLYLQHETLELVTRVNDSMDKYDGKWRVVDPHGASPRANQHGKDMSILGGYAASFNPLEDIYECVKKLIGNHVDHFRGQANWLGNIDPVEEFNAAYEEALAKYPVQSEGGENAGNSNN